MHPSPQQLLCIAPRAHTCSAPLSAVFDTRALTVSALLSVPHATTFEPHTFVPQCISPYRSSRSSTPLFTAFLTLPTFLSCIGLGHLTPLALGQLASCGFPVSLIHSHMLRRAIACIV
ncbi:hypothetical protein BU25DRAFT_105188 [Macroventuria anomochaeta]|uniref:Uncharacterized protein n=1 Tax=Macroventuria anomochaeta TaxID=301207 RepID=A0ACB6RVS8_9PLEO|nr:uncharacterized protein BU25DRAFT_105188 [Macroventuria anomochaeta]KAF2625879.1 hypothetical protein BU25DRAFT_105188 [Macroventuria anomochaeta]